MGSCGVLIALEQSEYDGLLIERGKLEDFVFEKTENPECESVLDIDKTWHAIHFILSGNSEGDGEGALNDVVLGGSIIGTDYFAATKAPTQVAASAEALKHFTSDIFKIRFNPKVLKAADIYPDIWDEGVEELLEYVVPFFEDLREFYLRAAKEGKAVLCCVM